VRTLSALVCSKTTSALQFSGDPAGYEAAQPTSPPCRHRRSRPGDVGAERKSGDYSSETLVHDSYIVNFGIARRSSNRERCCGISCSDLSSR
jgi:hypothetical protein